MDGDTDLHIRKKLYDIIAKNPGLHVSKLAELLNVNIPSVIAHLQYMEKRELIVALPFEGYERYYVKEVKTGIRDKRLIKTRRKIYDFVANNPGLHLSKIAELLHMSVPLTDYHMHQLEAEAVVTVVKEDGYKRYYIADSKIGLEDKKTLALLRHETLLKIVLFLIKHPHAKHKDLCNHLGITSSLLSYHLNKLVDQDIIEIPAATEGLILKNKQEILKILRRYQLQSILERFTDTWDKST